MLMVESPKSRQYKLNEHSRHDHLRRRPESVLRINYPLTAHKFRRRTAKAATK